MRNIAWVILFGVLLAALTAQAGESVTSVVTYTRSTPGSDPLVKITGAVAEKLFSHLESGSGTTQERLEITVVDAGDRTECIRTISRVPGAPPLTRYLCKKDFALDNSPAAERLYNEHQAALLSATHAYNGVNLRCSSTAFLPRPPSLECAFHTFSDGTTEGDAVIAGP